MITGIGPLKLTTPVGTADTPAGVPGTGAEDGISFASMVSDTAGRTVDRMRAAEQLSVEALQGKGDMRQVADAVMSAEQSFQAAVAIRDKIVAAYLEVSRMAI